MGLNDINERTSQIKSGAQDTIEICMSDGNRNRELLKTNV